MRRIFIYENGINFVFEIDETGSARILHLSPLPFVEGNPKAEFPLANVKVSGQEIGRRLKFKGFKDTGNQQGRKLEITLFDEITGLIFISHFQFFNGKASVKNWVTAENVTEDVGLPEDVDILN